MVIKCIYMCIFYVYINTIITFIMSLKLKGEINYKGQIEYWCNVKGYGLIAYDKKQAFVHSSNCKSKENEWIEFEKGDMVSFTIDNDNNIALKVLKIDGEKTPDVAPKSPNANSPGSMSNK
jgi:cold shock CspA family protein